jgi:hypothetical protein
MPLEQITVTPLLLAAKEAVLIHPRTTPLEAAAAAAAAALGFMSPQAAPTPH